MDGSLVSITSGDNNAALANIFSVSSFKIDSPFATDSETDDPPQ